MDKAKVIIDDRLVGVDELAPNEVIGLLMEITQRIVDEYAHKEENRIGVAITVAAGNGSQAMNCMSGVALATDRDPDVLTLLGGAKASADSLSKMARVRMSYEGPTKNGIN